MAFGARARQHGSDERRLRERVSFLRFEGTIALAASKLTFQCDVFGGYQRMAAQVIAKREMPAFLIRADDAQVTVVRARPFGWLLKERIDEVKRTQPNVVIANSGESLHEDAHWFQGRDGNLDVDHWFGSQAGNGS